MKPITSLTKDFIERCVMPDEELRMGYREIFIHTLVRDQFPNAIQEMQKSMLMNEMLHSGIYS